MNMNWRYGAGCSRLKSSLHQLLSTLWFLAVNWLKIWLRHSATECNYIQLISKFRIWIPNVYSQSVCYFMSTLFSPRPRSTVMFDLRNSFILRLRHIYKKLFHSPHELHGCIQVINSSELKWNMVFWNDEFLVGILKVALESKCNCMI